MMTWGFSGISRASPLVQDEEQENVGQEYVVKPGDSLSRISASFYGTANRWSEIFDATNAKAREDNNFASIRNPSLIYTGQKLWIPSVTAVDQPGEPAQQVMEPTPQPTEAIETSTEPTPQPAEGSGGGIGQLDEAVSTSTSSEDRSAPAQLLLAAFGTDGALAGAQSQVELAQTHLGFLQSALSSENQTEVRSHAEHVVNILEGEEGVLFGDNDRNGQAQNPGDGVGVRGHIAQALSQTQAVLDALATAGDSQAQVQELVTLQLSSQELVQEATDKAFQVFAADTPSEIETIGADLESLLNDLQANIADSFALVTLLIGM
jgi:LysM repeat protein